MAYLPYAAHTAHTAHIRAVGVRIITATTRCHASQNLEGFSYTNIAFFDILRCFENSILFGKQHVHTKHRATGGSGNI